MHVSNVDTLHINDHSSVSKAHGAWSWLNMKNHPENVINRIVKNAWGSHIREDTVFVSAEHTLALPCDFFFPFHEAN